MLRDLRMLYPDHLVGVTVLLFTLTVAILGLGGSSGVFGGRSASDGDD